jgi:CHASE2 domain-containing sensor protein
MGETLNIILNICLVIIGLIMSCWLLFLAKEYIIATCILAITLMPAYEIYKNLQIKRRDKNDKT